VADATARQLSLFGGDDAKATVSPSTVSASTRDDPRATVVFVGLDDYEVPVDALRRILRLVTAQARRSPGLEAS